MWLHLRHGGEGPDRNLLVVLATPPAPGELAGYAHLDPTDPSPARRAEVVVHPAHRGRGFGRLLVEAALRGGPGAPAAAVGARRPPRGPRARGVAGLQRGAPAVSSAPLAARAAARRPPAAGRAAADLPARGGRRGLARAERRGLRGPPGAGPVDAAGPARADGRGLVRPGRASCWPRPRTASSPASTGPRCTAVTTAQPRSHGHEAIGEVYVVGVSTRRSRGGASAGRSRVAGLRHLRGRGLDQAMLYVEADNAGGPGRVPRAGLHLVGHRRDVPARDPVSCCGFP